MGIQPDRLAQLRPSDKGLPVDASNPFFLFDPNKCVVCGICVRTCDEIVGRGTLDFVDRGFRTVIGTFGNKSFIESTCESCGECVVRCPVGALAPKKPKFAAREVQTTCVYCGVGCGIYLGVSGDKVVKVRAQVTDICPPGFCSMTFHFHESPTNEIANPARLRRFSKTPATHLPTPLSEVPGLASHSKKSRGLRSGRPSRFRRSRGGRAVSPRRVRRCCRRPVSGAGHRRSVF